MQIVIDIPNNAFKNGICEGDTDRIVRAIVDYVGCCSAELLNILNTAIPLPKGHGRLIDADALKTSYGLECATKYGNESKEQLENSYSTMMLYEIADMLDYAPTIIEADKEARE